MKNQTILDGQMSIFDFVAESINPHLPNNMALKARFVKKYGKQATEEMVFCNIIRVRKNLAGREIWIDNKVKNKSGVPAIYQFLHGKIERTFVDYIDFESTDY